MKTEVEMRKYLEYQGVPFTEPMRAGVPVLRLMDTSQIPQSMREQFDERGFFIAPETKPKEQGGKK